MKHEKGNSMELDSSKVVGQTELAMDHDATT